MASIYVGTSGYGYTAWVGTVYPEALKPARFLSHYATLFPTVELNRPFYAMPTADQLRRNLEQAEYPFMFAVKANTALTHTVDPHTWKSAAGSFKEAIEAFRSAKRLAAVLFQFSSQFRNTEDSRRYLFSLLEEFADLPTAVEFRHAGWYTNAMVDACRSRRVAIVSADFPDLPGMPPLVDVVTSPIAYFRFHGRNREGWSEAASGSRYDYVYSEAELEGLAGRVKGIAPRAERIFVYFNNGGMAANARTFTAILSRLGLRS